jgi:hypothetical protein
MLPGLARTVRKDRVEAVADMGTRDRDIQDKKVPGFSSLTNA